MKNTPAWRERLLTLPRGVEQKPIKIGAAQLGSFTETASKLSSFLSVNKSPIRRGFRAGYLA